MSQRIKELDAIIKEFEQYLNGDHDDRQIQAELERFAKKFATNVKDSANNDHPLVKAFLTEVRKQLSGSALECARGIRDDIKAVENQELRDAEHRLDPMRTKMPGGPTFN